MDAMTLRRARRSAWVAFALVAVGVLLGYTASALLSSDDVVPARVASPSPAATPAGPRGPGGSSGPAAAPTDSPSAVDQVAAVSPTPAAPTTAPTTGPVEFVIVERPGVTVTLPQEPPASAEEPAAATQQEEITFHPPGLARDRPAAADTVPPWLRGQAVGLRSDVPPAAPKGLLRENFPAAPPPRRD